MGKQDLRNLIRSEFDLTLAGIRKTYQRGTGHFGKELILQKKSNSCQQNCPAQAE